MSWFREPLVQLLLAGIALFGLYHFSGAGKQLRSQEPQSSIVLSAAGVRALAQEWENTMGAAPTDAQLRGQIEQHLHTELLYREALSLGLDVDDLVVKRRMAQKMQFLLEYTTPAEAPGGDDIRAYYEQHQAAYMRPARVDFSHVFVSRDKYQASTGDRAVQLSDQVGDWRPQPGQPVEYGDEFFSGQHFAGRTEAQIARMFDPALAAVLFALPAGQWSGPHESVFGAHLLWVHQQHPAAPLPLAQVSEKISAQIQRERQARATEASMNQLRQRYRIEVDYPPWNQASKSVP